MLHWTCPHVLTFPNAPQFMSSAETYSALGKGLAATDRGLDCLLH